MEAFLCQSITKKKRPAFYACAKRAELWETRLQNPHGLWHEGSQALVTLDLHFALYFKLYCFSVNCNHLVWKVVERFFGGFFLKMEKGSLRVIYSLTLVMFLGVCVSGAKNKGTIGTHPWNQQEDQELFAQKKIFGDEIVSDLDQDEFHMAKTKQDYMEDADGGSLHPSSEEFSGTHPTPTPQSYLPNLSVTYSEDKDGSTGEILTKNNVTEQDITRIYNPLFPVTNSSYSAYGILFLALVVFAVGIVGNLAVMCIVWHNYFMRSAWNYILASLAFWDFLVLCFCLPVVVFNELTHKRLLGDFSCRVVPYIEVGLCPRLGIMKSVIH